MACNSLLNDVLSCFRFSLLFMLKKLFLFIILLICLKTLRAFLLKLNTKQLFQKLTDSLAKITLEIYLVQMVVIDLCAEHLAFPLSFVVAVVGIYVYAIIVNSISTQVRRIVEKIVIRKKKAKI